MERTQAGDQRHLVETQDGSAMEGCAREVRTVADVLRPVRKVEAGRHVGALTEARTNQVRCSGRDTVDSKRRQHDGKSASARGRSEE